MTGESVAQVASQTLESMHAINAVTTMPILRPLVAMDKGEIIALAERIGTFEICAALRGLLHPLCPGTPRNPATHRTSASGRSGHAHR